MKWILPAVLTVNKAVAIEKTAQLVALGLPLHIDIVDASWGEPTLRVEVWRELLQSNRPVFVEFHLMVDEPMTIIPQLKGVADAVIIQLERFSQPEEQQAVRSLCESNNLQLIWSSNPNTEMVDYLNNPAWQIMGVVPGKAGQPQLNDTADRVASKARDNRVTILGVDGGVTTDNAPGLIKAGANRLVVNSAYWGADDQAAVLKQLTAILDGGADGISGSD